MARKAATTKPPDSVPSTPITPEGMLGVAAFAAGLEVHRVPIESLHHDPANVRTHDERNLLAIEGSLKQFGQVEPLVVQAGTGKVIGGNGRLEAMRKMGLKEVDVVALEVNDTQATALGIALNRTAELAGWDFENLAKLMQGLQTDGFDLGAIGWSDYELGPLLGADFAPPPPTDESFGGETVAADSIKLNREQREVFERVKALLKRDHPEVTDGMAVEMLSAGYLAEHGHKEREDA